MKKKVQINTLLHSAKINSGGTISLNENTYDFDPEYPKNNWLQGAFLAFQELKKQGFKPKIFATVGTGSGLDSIGAYEVFHPEKIFQTDIHPNVIEIAQNNISNFICGKAHIDTFLGNLCEPLIERNITVDLLYANLPNIQSKIPVLNGKMSSSYFERSNETCPRKFNTWLLNLQYRFLSQAKKVLNPAGVVLIALGDRVPPNVVEELFVDTGFTGSELINLYKIQTEPEEVIKGYAVQEFKTGIKFDFYKHEGALRVWQQDAENKNLSVEEIKKKLKPFHLNATEALYYFQNEGKSVGHIYSIFRLYVN